MAFDKKVTLQILKKKTGSSGGYDIIATADVWCDYDDIGSMVAFSALAAGVTVTKQITMWKNEFKDYTHAIVDGVQYKVNQTAKTKNPLHFKLLLVRG